MIVISPGGRITLVQFYISDCMPYLIDGHNLIPKIKGLHLDQLDDEQSLLSLLEKYFKRIRKEAVVYFDKASLSSRLDFNSAFLNAHFVHAPSTADEAIILQLQKLGGDAKNYTVVTSDHWVADKSRAVGASLVSSENFAQTLLKDPQKAQDKSKSSENDIDYWLDIFQNNS